MWNRLESLPESLTNLKKLRLLDLTYNPLIKNPDTKIQGILKKLEKNGVNIKKEFVSKKNRN